MSIPLRAKSVSKQFGGIAALTDVSIVAPPGLITGLIGQNGAGKTTLVNVIAQQIPADAGRVYAGERELTGLPPFRVPAAGVARTFQQLRLFPTLSVLDNVLLGFQQNPGEAIWRTLLQPRAISRQRRKYETRAYDILSSVGLEAHAAQPADTLSYGLQKLLSLARLMATEADILMLDEPTSGLSSDAIETIVAVVRRLKGQGKTVLLIEHDMEVVFELCDWIIVMDQGRVFCEGPPADIRANAGVRSIYSGSRVG